MSTHACSPQRLKKDGDDHEGKIARLRGELATIYDGGRSDVAAMRIAELGSAFLAEFICDAYNRGWITNFNMGIDE